MGEMGEVFREMRAANKQRKNLRLKDAGPLLQALNKHTLFHYSTSLMNERLDYWPTTGKWRWKDKNYFGTPDDLANFLKKRKWKSERSPKTGNRKKPKWRKDEPPSFNLPSYSSISDKNIKHRTRLEQFIYNWEPAGHKDAELWREQLSCVMDNYERIKDQNETHRSTEADQRAQSEGGGSRPKGQRERGAHDTSDTPLWREPSASGGCVDPGAS